MAADQTFDWQLEPIGWPARLARLATLFIVAVCAWSVAGLWVEAEVVRTSTTLTWHDTSNLSIVFRALSAALVAFGVLSFIYIMWVWRAWKNVSRRRLGEAGLLGSTRVRWWWFVPGLNLALPVYLVVVLWRASADPADPPGSTEWAARRLPTRVIVWAAGQALALAVVAFTYFQQPTFEEMWSCVWNPVSLRWQDCAITEVGRAAWIDTNLILAVMFVAQVGLGLLFFRILGDLNAMQGRLVAAYTAGRREDLWLSLRQPEAAKRTG